MEKARSTRMSLHQIGFCRRLGLAVRQQITVPRKEQASVMASSEFFNLSRCAKSHAAESLDTKGSRRLSGPVTLACGLATVLVAMPTFGQGVTASWTGADALGDDFDLAGNWSVGAVPGLEDIARFALNQTYDVTWDATTGDVEVEGRQHL